MKPIKIVAISYKNRSVKTDNGDWYRVGKDIDLNEIIRGTVYQVDIVGKTITSISQLKNDNGERQKIEYISLYKKLNYLISLVEEIHKSVVNKKQKKPQKDEDEELVEI